MKLESYNPELEAQLLKIGEDDQSFRGTLQLLQMQENKNYDSIILISNLIGEFDSANLIKIKQLHSYLGKWPGVDKVGEKGNQAFFLVIQHADIKTQIKFLSSLRKSVKEKQSPKYFL